MWIISPTKYSNFISKWENLRTDAGHPIWHVFLLPNLFMRLIGGYWGCLRGMGWGSIVGVMGSGMAGGDDQQPQMKNWYYPTQGRVWSWSQVPGGFVQAWGGRKKKGHRGQRGKKVNLVRGPEKGGIQKGAWLGMAKCCSKKGTLLGSASQSGTIYYQPYPLDHVTYVNSVVSRVPGRLSVPEMLKCLKRLLL